MRAGLPSIMLLVAATPFLSTTMQTAATSINSSKNEQPGWSSVALGTVPRGVALDPKSATIYAVMYLNGTTFAMDSKSLHIVARIATPSPYAVAIDSTSNKAYVSQGEGASLSVIDGRSKSVVGEVHGAGTPYALTVDEKRGLVLAADTSANSLWIINGSKDSVIAWVPIGDTPALAVDPFQEEAFVGNLSSDQKSGTVDIVNESNFLSPVRTVQVPFPPMRFSVDSSLHLIFVTPGEAVSGATPNFLAIDDRTLKVAYGVNIGNASPDMMAVSPSHDVYVTDSGKGRIYELDGMTGQLLQNFSSYGGGASSTGEVTSMIVNPSDGRLFLTERDDPELLVLVPPQAAPSAGIPMGYAYAGVLIVVAAAVVVAAGSFALVLRRRRSGRRHPSPSQTGSKSTRRVGWSRPGYQDLASGPRKPAPVRARQ